MEGRQQLNWYPETSFYRGNIGYKFFCCCPECKEDFGSDSVLDKPKHKYDMYDNILEDCTDITFKLFDRIGKNHKDMDGKEEH